VLYRDMGPTRNLGALETLLKEKHKEIAATRPSLERWSRIHDWQARVKAHDQAMAKGRAQGVQMLQPPAVLLDSNFDQVDALLRAANQALTRAMSAAPVVTRPGDVKALVDAAANALRLIETIKNQSSGKVSREEIAQEIARVLGEVEKARFVDVDTLVDAELKKLGLQRSADGGTEPLPQQAHVAIVPR
jgi:hypothetical protein